MGWRPISARELLWCTRVNVTHSCLHPSLLQPETQLHNTSYNSWKHHNMYHKERPFSVTHPGLVKCIVLQAKEAGTLAGLQGWGCGWRQQVGWLGDHGWVWSGGEGSRKREALQLPLSLLLQHLAHHHLLLLVETGEKTASLQDVQDTCGCKFLLLHSIHLCFKIRDSIKYNLN